MGCQVGARAAGASSGSTSTRAEWKAPPPPRSVSSSVVNALAMVPPGLREAHQPEGSATTPGPTTSPIRARASTSPRALRTRTTSPSAMARGRSVVGVKVEHRLALAREMARQVGVGRVEEVVRALDGHERQRLGVAGRRVEAGRQVLRPQAQAPRRRPEAALRERPEVLGQVGLGPAHLAQALEVDGVERRPRAGDRRARQLLVGGVERRRRRSPSPARGGGRSRCWAAPRRPARWPARCR